MSTFTDRKAAVTRMVVGLVPNLYYTCTNYENKKKRFQHFWGSNIILHKPHTTGNWVLITSEFLTHSARFGWAASTWGKSDNSRLSLVICATFNVDPKIFLLWSAQSFCQLITPSSSLLPFQRLLARWTWVNPFPLVIFLHLLKQKTKKG